MGLGVTLLWLEHYEDAYGHFRSRIEVDRWAGDMDYGMAGVATPEQAAAQAWKFTTENGGTSIRIRGQ